MAGTTQVSLLGFLGYDEESAFAEVLSTYDKVLQIRDATLDFSGIVQEMVRRGGVFGRPNQGDFHIPGPHQGATLTFTMDLYGHGSATTGSLTEAPLARLLGHVHGHSDVTQVGDTSLGAGTDADTLGVADGALLAGGLIRVGALADARGGGQAAVVSSGGGGGAVELLTSIGATNNSGDALHAMQMIYAADTTARAHLTSDGSDENNTLRFVVSSGNKQYVLRGCACTAVTYNGFNTAEVPSVTVTFGVAYWDDISVTFPSATASADFAPAPCANGSFLYQNVGTTTRQTDNVRNVSFSIEHEMHGIIAQGGLNPNQVIQGWVRGKSMPTLSFDIEAPAATASPVWGDWWNTDPNTITARHFLYTLNPTAGRSVALYLPNARPAGPRPTQQDLEGLAYVNVVAEGVEGPTVTNTLTRSAWRLGLG